MIEETVANWLSRDMPPIRREGVLTKKEVAQAATAYLNNGVNLFDDALLLASNSRPSRAAALAVLGLEEIAKIPQLINAFLHYEHHVDENAWIDYWKSGGRHGTKQEIILTYGKIIRNLMDGDPLHDRKLYRHYAPVEILGNLDRFKQSNFYVDIRTDGIHAPDETENTLQAFDYLITFGQERADSFCSWHVSEQRSLDYLEVALGQRVPGQWTSYQTSEVLSDILYQAASSSASQIPDYVNFYDFMEHYQNKAAQVRIKSALLDLAKRLRMRIDMATTLPFFYSRFIGTYKLIYGLSHQQEIFGKSFSRKLKGVLVPEQPNQVP